MVLRGAVCVVLTRGNVDTLPGHLSFLILSLHRLVPSLGKMVTRERMRPRSSEVVMLSFLFFVLTSEDDPAPALSDVSE